MPNAKQQSWKCSVRGWLIQHRHWSLLSWVSPRVLRRWEPLGKAPLQWLYDMDGFWRDFSERFNIGPINMAPWLYKYPRVTYLIPGIDRGRSTSHHLSSASFSEAGRQQIPFITNMGKYFVSSFLFWVMAVTRCWAQQNGGDFLCSSSKVKLFC